MKISDIAKINKNAIVFEPREYHDRAIIGMVGKRVAYHKAIFIETLQDALDNCSIEEAQEWFEYNTIRALPYMDEKDRPVFCGYKKLTRRIK